jgi:DMSO/TMAO reductase YedYZ molybdopterin-dependent catalytic subunit
MTRRAAIVALIGFALPAYAADGIAIDGQVQHPTTLSLTEIEALPATDITASFETSKGSSAGHYKGVLLWTLLDKAGLPEETGKNHHHLQRSVRVIGSDGYAVALSLGELEPDFEGKQVVLAYETDGKPEPSLRLVVPGDHKAGRNVHDVVRVTVE